MSKQRMFDPLKVGDVLIVTRELTWDHINTHHIGDIVVVLSIQGEKIGVTDRGQRINLLSSSHVIEWSPEWHGMSCYFRHAS